ncbi:aminotransferase class V-fold PLP-dependent enzyme [Streptomyces sp. NPDC088923]|uniref:aminotransferase class V-fold PLP-dependent enzyme n=1 Tax=Streptomyces sp. NPDC088923 TaxID=3365913 RepID=UPI0038188033
MTHPLLDLTPLTAHHFAAIERKVAALLGLDAPGSGGHELVVTQGEALLPLEGCIRGVAGPGTVALNLVTGPYGQTFGNWLRDCGATVHDLAVPFDTAVSAEQVREALQAHPETDFVSLVHAEAATGNTNPVAEIGEVVREHGALLMLDAVASVGAEPLLPAAWGVDLCVIGAQKALGGPAGVSVAALSPRAWERLEANRAAPRGSYLSLLDWKHRWIDAGRKALPHAPAQLEMLALEACLERFAAEGPDVVRGRHARAAAAVRAGLAALGTPLTPYVTEARDAAPVATTVRVPVAGTGPDAGTLVAKALAARPSLPLAAGGGALAAEMIRVNHYGPLAAENVVRDSLRALAAAWSEATGEPADTRAADRAVAETWAAGQA